MFALANIRKFYKTHDTYLAITDVNLFFDEFFKGYSTTQANLEKIL
jgi:hypothetical protein